MLAVVIMERRYVRAVDVRDWPIRSGYMIERRARSISLSVAAWLKGRGGSTLKFFSGAFNQLAGPFH